MAGFFSQRCSDEAKAPEFYQVIDKLERENPAETQEKLRALGFALEEVAAFIEAGEPTTELNSILQNLAARGLAEFVKVDYNVIRGLAYYTGVVFEAFDKKGEFRAIAGGGRYDDLVKLIAGGKVDLPAIGFGMGDVVLLELLKERKLLPEFQAQIDLYVLIEDESLRAESLGLTQETPASVHCGICAHAHEARQAIQTSPDLQAALTAKLVNRTEGPPIILFKNLKTRTELRVNSLLELAAARTREKA